MGKKNNKIGVVYSTNPDFEYTYEEDETVESKVPTASNKTFTLGEPAILPSTVIFPATQNNPNSNTMKVR